MFELILQFLSRIVIGFLINTLCYYVGWFICKVATWGRYPYNYPHEEGLITDYIFMSIETFVGFIVVFSAFLFVIINYL